MFITRKHLSRRAVLRGAGAAIGLPLLDAMIPAATALAATAAAPRPRVGFLYFPHGAIMSEWEPKQTGPQFEFSPILKPLEPFRSHVTVVSGLRNKPTESPDPHNFVAMTWLSCFAPHNRDPEGEGGITADQIAAKHIGQDTPLPSLELTGENGSTVSYRTPTQPLPMEGNPRKIFYQLFGQGDTSEERSAILRQRGSLLDYIKESSDSLVRDLDAGDRRRVDDYLDSVREIERRVQKLAGGSASARDLPDAPLGVPEDITELLDVQLEMIALAFQADQTRVASMMLGKEISMRSFGMVDVPDAFHPLSHHQNDRLKLQKLVRVQKFHTERVAKLAKRLASIQDGNGSMLDHSIILYGSNMSNSDLHNNNPLPSVLLGRAAGKVKGGQHLRYPADTPHANLLVTMLNRAGVAIGKLGDSTGQFAEI